MYQLVITEKRSVANRIAAVIGATQERKGYFEGREYLVSWCRGHFVEPAQPESYGKQWKNWNYESLPIQPKEWQYVVREETKEQYQIVSELMHRDDVSTLICACDVG